MLSSVESSSTIIIADFEAGIGTLTRLPQGAIDAVLIVVEPTPRSLEVGKRAAELVVESRVDRVVIIANRIQTGEDLSAISTVFPDFDTIVIPYDDAIVEADRAGLAPLDTSPGSPAVSALALFAREFQSSVI